MRSASPLGRLGRRSALGRAWGSTPLLRQRSPQKLGGAAAETLPAAG